MVGGQAHLQTKQHEIIKPVAELCLSEDIREGVSQSVSRKFNKIESF